MVHAATFGHINFGDCDGTARWWIGARMKLRAVEDELYLRTLALSTHRAIGVQAMTDLGQDTDWRQKYANEACDRYQKESMPWLGAAKAQNDQNAALDDIAAWYAVFGKQYGVL
jgi:hypothetical protein